MRTFGLLLNNYGGWYSSIRNKTPFIECLVISHQTYDSNALLMSCVCRWKHWTDSHWTWFPNLIFYVNAQRQTCVSCMFVCVCVCGICLGHVLCVCVCSLYVCAYACVRFVYITHIKENNCIIQGNARMRKNRKYEKKTTKTLNYK